MGGQPIFVRDSFQINVRCDRKKVIAEIRSDEIFVEVLEKFVSVSERTYVLKPEQKEAVEHLLNGRDILAV